jgi:hypothetical protein
MPARKAAKRGNARGPRPPAFTFGRQKYNAQKTVYKGETYPSKSEAAWAEVLDRDPVVFEVVRQPRFVLGTEPDGTPHTYRPDFLVILNPFEPLGAYLGQIVAATGLAFCADEVKGAETPEFKKNRQAWLANGRMALRIIKRGKVVEVLIPDRFVESKDEDSKV